MKKNTILWADDDVDDLQMMREILMKNNKDFNLVEVGNGKQALEYLENKPDADLPCLIILDINMSVLDGKEALSFIKRNERLSDIPVVVFTTSASELDKLYCKRLGTEMITKPPSYTKLESVVVKLLEMCNGH